MRTLVIHDLREQPPLCVLGQDCASAHFERELLTFGRRRALWSLGNRDLGVVMRRLRLGDVVESGRRIGSSTRPMAAGTGCRAVAQGVADAPVPTAQTAELTVHGTLDGTSPRQSPVGSLACRISSTDSVWNAGRAPATPSDSGTKGTP